MLVNQCRILSIFLCTLPIPSPKLQHGAARSEVICSKIQFWTSICQSLIPSAMPSNRIDIMQKLEKRRNKCDMKAADSRYRTMSSLILSLSSEKLGDTPQPLPIHRVQRFSTELPSQGTVHPWMSMKALLLRSMPLSTASCFLPADDLVAKYQFFGVQFFFIHSRLVEPRKKTVQSKNSSHCILQKKQQKSAPETTGSIHHLKRCLIAHGLRGTHGPNVFAYSPKLSKSFMAFVTVLKSERYWVNQWTLAKPAKWRAKKKKTMWQCRTQFNRMFHQSTEGVLKGVLVRVLVWLQVGIQFVADFTPEQNICGIEHF